VCWKSAIISFLLFTAMGLFCSIKWKKSEFYLWQWQIAANYCWLVKKKMYEKSLNSLKFKRCFLITCSSDYIINLWKIGKSWNLLRGDYFLFEIIWNTNSLETLGGHFNFTAFTLVFMSRTN